VALVDDLRRMTAVSETQYEIDGSPFWDDEQLQASIEGRLCGHYVQAPIDLIPSISESGSLQFLDGQIPVNGTLDSEKVVVVNFGGSPIDGVTAHGDGRIEFKTDQATHVPLLTGLAYDLNGAAADVLTAWAAAVQQGYDVTIDGQQMRRSQRHEQLLKQAETYRARAVVGTVKLHRTDVRMRRGSRTTAAMQAFERLGHPG
jgi:hypothetical protein